MFAKSTLSTSSTGPDSGAEKVWSHPQSRSYNHLHGKQHQKGSSPEASVPKGQPGPGEVYQTHFLSSAPETGWFVIALTDKQWFVFPQAAMPPPVRLVVPREDRPLCVVAGGISGHGKGFEKCSLEGHYRSTKTSRSCWCRDLSTRRCEQKLDLSFLTRVNVVSPAATGGTEGKGFGARHLPSSVKPINTSIRLTTLQIWF